MRLLLFITGIMLLLSCEKQTTWELQSADTKTLVVDGIITNEYKNHSIRLSYSSATTAETPAPVSGASVVVEGKIRTFLFEESPVGSGNYVSTIPFSANVQTSYRLRIIVNGKMYYADAEMVPVRPMLNMTFEPLGDKDSLYKIKFIAAAYHAFDPAMYEITLDWSELPAYDSLPQDSCRARLYFYSLTSIDVSEFFSPTQEKVHFPKGTKVTERKYSITEEHETFLRSMLFETSWRGGYFDETPANLHTNVSGGAMGFFGACAVIEREYIVK